VSVVISEESCHAGEVANDEHEPPFEALARETRRLFHQLRVSAEYLHDDPELTAAHRAMLETLYREGPQTVPAVARARSVSRQHIQVLVNHLLDIELVAVAPNPANRRSPFISLTEAGKRQFETMRRREHRALATPTLPVSARKIRDATETLSALRQHLARHFSPAP
jgi:DNA-binding MarR family transcriptional regulator